jgi:hypothetical protein
MFIRWRPAGIPRKKRLGKSGDTWARRIVQPVTEMARRKIRFVIPMPFTSKKALKLISKYRKTITDL